MAQLVLIGVLNRTLDEDDPYVQDFKNTYKTLPIKWNDDLRADLLAPGDIGSNGGGGDGTRALSFRTSDLGFSAQRWTTYPTATFNKNSDGMLSDVIFPRVLRAQFCLVFNGRQDYSRHLARFEPFYERYFAYVTTFLVTEEFEQASDVAIL